MPKLLAPMYGDVWSWEGEMTPKTIIKLPDGREFSFGSLITQTNGDALVWYENEKDKITKHMAGKHDQSTHGSGNASGGSKRPRKYPSWEDLSEAQQSALTEYQSSGYKVINGYLRGNLHAAYTPDPERMAQVTKSLDSLIDDMPPISSDTTLYRGVRGELADKLLSLKQGDTFTDKGYTSTTTNYQIASNFAEGVTVLSGGSDSGVMIKINAPKGTKAYDLDRMFNESFEEEVILPRNTTFVVDKVQFLTIFVTVKNG